MVTDAVAERPQAETAFPYPLRLLLTLVVLALYWYGHRVPLPFVGPGIADLSPAFAARTSVLALETYPLWTGFFLVELFAVATSAGRRLRRGGAAGRARLNRAALIVSLSLAALQAASMARYLELMSGPGGDPIVATPGVGFSLITIVTLTAATAALFAAGQFLSAYGVGNGFALLALIGIAGGIVNALPGAQQEIEDLPAVGFGLLAALVLAMVAFRFIRKSEDQWLPAFPQSILPALAVPWLWALAIALSIPREAGLALLLVLIPLLSWAGFHLFSSRTRLETSLSEPEETLGGIAEVLRRRIVPATALLTVGTVALMAWQENWPSKLSFALTFPQILMALAIGLDLWDQYRFERRHGRWAVLARLDDVHFSYRLEERLQEEEIVALARGHQFRSLFFFFGALYKIDVLVPEEQLGRAREVMAEVEMAREIKAF
jgi:hypothetical protein